MMEHVSGPLLRLLLKLLASTPPELEVGQRKEDRP